MSVTCYWVDDLNDASKMSSSTAEDYIISNYLRNANNPVVGQTISSISFYLCNVSNLVGGSFTFGIWDNDGTLIRETDAFTAGDVATGTDYPDCEKFSKNITTASGGSYTLQTDDRIGVCCRTQPTGSGELFIGDYDKGSEINYWARLLFQEDSSSVAGEDEERALLMCVGTPATTSSPGIPPPPIDLRRF